MKKLQPHEWNIVPIKGFRDYINGPQNTKELINQLIDAQILSSKTDGWCKPKE